VSEPSTITSRDNPLLARVRRLLGDPSASRRLGQVWLEGEHLCSALRQRQLPAAQALISEAAWQGDPQLRELATWAAKTAVVSQAQFKALSGLESPASIGYLIDLPSAPALEASAPTVVLDRLQDAGNVGSILRSAAALGVRQVVALKGTAALWSPKVLRAGMGAHFGLRLIEGLGADELEALAVPLVVTSSHAGERLHRQALPSPCAWVLGHEGQGVAPELAARAALAVRIAQPGGEESLNVAAAAAICLHASAAQL
jgi:TrmH family RNA methyltransferase